MLDVHHVEYFLFWQALFSHRELNTIRDWLTEIYEYLLIRRRRDDALRLIATENDWESIFEFIVSGRPPSESYGRSSYLMLMLLELGFSLPLAERDTFVTAAYEHLILGLAGNGGSLKFKESVELAGWAPPADWEDLVLSSGLDSTENTGIAIMTHNFVETRSDLTAPVVTRIESFIHQTRQTYPFELVSRVPFAVLALGCIKTKTPLPSEFWRRFIFPPTPGASPNPSGEEGGQP